MHDKKPVNPKEYFLYSYDLSDTIASKKVRFVYLMKGRKGEKGIVNKLGGEYVSQSVFLLPASKESEMSEVMAMWGIPHTKREIWLID